MAKEYKILQPEAVTNMVTNPSIETATTGYTAFGAGSVAQSYTRQRRGAASLAITPTATETDGAYYGPVTLNQSVTYTWSVDVWGVVGVPYRIYFATTAPAVKGTPTTFTGDGRWHRYTVTWTADSAGSFRLYIAKVGNASTAVFYIDGMLLWVGDHETSYFDGDSVGFIPNSHYWTGTPHASTSVRSAQERSGGQEIDLQTIGFTVSNPIGSGMPAIAHHTQGRALQPGAEYVGYKVMPRVVELQGEIPGTDEDNTLERRKDVIDLIKPDRVKGAQPFILRHYLPNGRGPVCYRLVYDSGLEYNSGDPSETVNIRCIGYDPYAYEDGQEGASLTTSLSVANADEIVRKNAGTWANITTDFNNTVRAIVKGDDGKIYIGGSFTNVGTANGDYIVSWDPNASTLASLGTPPNNVIYALAKAPNGNIYLGGAFTDLTDVNGDRISYWNGSAYTSLSTGIGSGLVMALAFGLDGTLYVGGTFTNHVDANGDYITKWNGTAFSSLGTGMNGEVDALAVHPNGDIYAGGSFTTAGGTTVNGIAKWNGTAWSALGSGVAGVSASVFAIAIDKNGLVYIGGSFTSADGVSANYIARWNGYTFESLGSGVDAIVYNLGFTEDGLLIAAGQFTTAGGISLADQAAIWNGTTWTHIDADLPAASTIYTTLSYRDNLYLGYSGTGSATASALNTLTNSGTAPAYPIIKIKRSGGTSAVVEWLKNETTDAIIWLNYSLLDGEELVLDFRPGRRHVTSNFFGEVWRAVLRGSDFTGFFLQPGANSVSAYVNQAGTPTMTQTIHWDLIHQSADGAAA